MPITFGFELRPPSEEMFKEIAYAVTGAAFKVHNELGSFFAEKVYKHELAARCLAMGLRCVQIEEPVRVAFRDYFKDYFVDLLIDGGAPFELKVVSNLHDEHRAQTLNYLFLLGLPRAKLFNFGAASVQHEFVSTTLTHAQRKQFSVDHRRWRPKSDESNFFFDLLTGMLHDWGCFLHLPLYYDAVTYFFGGEDTVIRELPVTCEGHVTANQKVHLLNHDTAFKITAFGDRLEIAEEHLRRFLHHTPLRAIEWLNLHQHQATFTTLLNGP